MRTIRIFALPSHQSKDRTSGVDYARIISPMKHLNGYQDNDVRFQVDLFDIHEKGTTDWLKVTQTYDIIYLNYINNPWGFAAMGAMARKNGVKLVMDVDDSIWNLKSDNPAHAVYKKGSEGLHNFTSIVNEVDLLTVTHPYLKHVVMNNSKKRAHEIVTIDNMVDLDVYNFRPPFKDTGQIKLVHHGSTTHFKDLLEPEFVKGIDKIMSEYPNVTLQFVGAFIPYFRQRWGARYQNSYGHQDIYEWIKGKYREYMNEADIMITPLTDDVYNRSKSRIKFLENSAAAKPGVYQDIRQYSECITNGENGYLARTHQEWYKALKELIDDPKKRQEVGQKAFDSIQEHTIQKNIHLYAEMFRRLMI